MAATAHLRNADMKTLHKAIGTLIEMENDLDPYYAKEMNNLFQKTIVKASAITGRFLHKLHEKKPPQEVVKKVIKQFPKSLTYHETYIDFKRIPVNRALCHVDSFPYVHLLLEEGIQHNVGGAEGRGGFLEHSQDKHGQRSAFHHGLYTITAEWEENDYMIDGDTEVPKLNLLKDLRRLKIIHEDDIIPKFLVPWCNDEHESIFNYILDWKPLLLSKEHCMLAFQASERSWLLSMFLKAHLKRNPENLSLLLDDNARIFNYVWTKYGFKEVFRIIRKLIPSDGIKIPILHECMEKAPSCVDMFRPYYPAAMHLRDSSGRTLNQVRLAYDNLNFMSSAEFFTGMRDEEISEIDPGTDLYPFMVAASGESHCDLSAVYYLLRRAPTLASVNVRKKHKRSNSPSSQKAKRQKSEHNRVVN